MRLTKLDIERVRRGGVVANSIRYLKVLNLETSLILSWMWVWHRWLLKPI